MRLFPSYDHSKSESFNSQSSIFYILYNFPITFATNDRTLTIRQDLRSDVLLEF